MKMYFLWMFIGLFLVNKSYAINGLNEIINVKDYGAKGDGKTDDTKSLNRAFAAAATKNATLVFDSKTYLFTSITVKGTKESNIKKLIVSGNNAELKSISNGNDNVMSFYFVDSLKLTSLRVTGNMNNQTNGNGIGVYYCKEFRIENCEIVNCKYSGLTVGWVKNAIISNNKIHNNGDGSFASDGITIHSLEGGDISNNVLYENNPKSNQDGDGIHISQSQYGSEGYYNPQSLKRINIVGNLSYNHGRRGIKIQRSNVFVSENILCNNLIGIQVARNEKIENIQLINNFIISCQKGIGTDGAKLINIENLDIRDNEIVNFYKAIGIQINDSKNVNIEFNNFHNSANNDLDIDVNDNVQDINVKSRKAISLKGNQKVNYALTRNEKSNLDPLKEITNTNMLFAELNETIKLSYDFCTKKNHL